MPLEGNEGNEVKQNNFLRIIFFEGDDHITAKYLALVNASTK